MRLGVFVVHVFDDGAYMNSHLVGDKYRDLVGQLVDADIPSIRFVVLVADIIPAEALIRARPVSSRGGSVDPKIVKPRQPVVGALICVDERQYRNVLLPNGEVTLCSMDFERRHVLGNLLCDEYGDLFKSPVFCEIVDRMNGADG
ncbi:MAG: radical SAM protein, partial [Mesorhizobium sp.]